MPDFTDKHIVITGAGRPGQVGEVVARAFAERGARLALLERRRENAEAHAATLTAAGFSARPYVADLADIAQVEESALAVGRDFDGRIDALVHLAGGFGMSGPMAESTQDTFDRQISINLTTAYLVTRSFLPLLRPTRGSLVYFASAAVLPGGKSAGMSAYAAAKSGVVALMRAVAQEERDTGVRANALAPTAIRTAANLEDMGEGVRYVEREDVASAVLFLCSDEARAISGQVVPLS